jgi:mannose-6-phosphate isomerase-like protein (cupin superfamily)
MFPGVILSEKERRVQTKKEKYEIQTPHPLPHPDPALAPRRRTLAEAAPKMNPISIANAEHYLWGGDCDGWHLLQRNDLSIIQERVPPGRAEVRHYHNASRQFFHILAGVGTMQIDEETVTLHKGEGIEVLPQVPHQFRNESEEDVVFLVVSAPKSHGDRINC